MKRVIALMLAGTLLLTATTAGRAADGQIPDAALSQFGLGGAEVVSDADGEKIRGKYLFGPDFLVSMYIIVGFEDLGAANRLVNRLQAVNDRLAQRFPHDPVLNNPNSHRVNFNLLDLISGFGGFSGH